MNPRDVPRRCLLLAATLAVSLGGAEPPASPAGRAFAIEVVDEQTGRGVPMVANRIMYRLKLPD